jgi:RNA polymerase sigma factor (sigma-70 family)
MKQQYTDEELGVLIAQGDTDALWALVQRLQPVIAAIVCQIVRRDHRLAPFAEDLIQDAALEIGDLLQRYDPARAPVRGLVNCYLKARLLRLGRTRYLAAGRKGEDILGPLGYGEEHEPPADGDEPAASTNLIALAQVLPLLAQGQREAIEMVIIRGLTQAEACREIGISSAAMSVRFTGAMARIREAFGVEGGQ